MGTKPWNLPKVRDAIIGKPLNEETDIRGSYRGSPEATTKITFMKTNMNQTTIDAGRFDVAKIAATLPETASTLLVDRYLTNREAASARVFRVYKPTPPHYHATCDEYLYVFSGQGTFWMEDESTSAEFGPGELLFFKRGTVHAQPTILADPVVFLSIDTPRRDPKDIVFVNPEDGTPESFIQADQ
jgi:mannose-6-phosphate isomerase-like protein (cupin superfamily)